VVCKLRKGREVDHHLPAFCSEAEARARLFVADIVLAEKMKMKERKRSRQILVLEAMKVRWNALLCYLSYNAEMVVFALFFNNII